MRIRIPRQQIVALLILTGCIIVGGFFWVLAGGYRAVSPLVFILGIIGYFASIKGMIKNPFAAEPAPDPDIKALMETKQLDRQKKILWRDHIPELISGLFLKHIRHYPEWKEHSPEIVPSAVTAAVRTREENLKVIMYFNEYEFRFKEWSYTTPDRLGHTHGLLEIFLGNHKVFGLLVAKEKTELTDHWVARDIEAFSAGQWLNDFKKLSSEIIVILKTRAREAREN